MTVGGGGGRASVGGGVDGGAAAHQAQLVAACGKGQAGALERWSAALLATETQGPLQGRGSTPSAD